MKSKSLVSYIILACKGVLVGFGAIMPGISGGTLCVAFGMYHILLDCLTHPFQTLRKHGWEIVAFVAGGGIGFVGLAGLASWLLALDAQAVTCAFVGFILGTVPELWQNAGEQGRGKSSYASMGMGFVVMLAILLAFRFGNAVTIAPGVGAYLFCGVVWGLSFIVPGLSSSTLLLFFGLYQPMLDGISHLDFAVLIPLALGMGVCVLILPRAVNAMFARWYAVLSHAILGIVLASTLLIIPVDAFHSVSSAAVAVLCIVCGAAVSYFAGRACAKLEARMTK